MRHRLRYVYTPRRSGFRGFRRRGPSIPAPLVVIALLAVVIGGYLLVRDDGGEGASGPRVLGAQAGVQASPSPAAAPPGGDGSPDGGGGQHPSGPLRAGTPNSGPAPAITGRAAAVLEAPCGIVLYDLNGEVPQPPASLTKVMTALVVADHADFSDTVSVTINGPELSLATDSTVMGIEPGQTLTVRDLVYGLLLPSGNDAAVQLAEYIAGDVSSFVRMMNEKAEAMGLTSTHFANPHGLDDAELYTSAIDIGLLADELLKNVELAEAVRTRAYQPGWDGPAIENLNQLLEFYPGAIGVKTGFTDSAGQTMVAAAQRDGRTVIVSVLGSTLVVYEDVTSLLDWAFEATRPACRPD